MNKKISIIILNWNRKEMAKECLNSIMPQVNKNFEIIVVDNASTDGSVEYLEKLFPKIKIIQSNENRGYAGGNNLGVRGSTGNYVLILNNDVIVDKDMLKEIWAHKDDADILGVKSYYYNKKDILWSVGSKVNKFTLRARLVGNKVLDDGQFDRIDVDYITGSAMLVNKKVIDKIGFLDENYFMYFEETEWQIRAKNAGFSISWIPSAKIWHKVGFSTGGQRSPASAYYLTRNRAYCIDKYSRYKIIAFSYWAIEIIARLIWGLFNNKDFSRMSLNGAIDFLKKKDGSYFNASK